MSDYQRALDWIFSFAHFDSHPPHIGMETARHLGRMRALLARLDNPHEKFTSLHIAGTKGKGSTAALSESILRHAGIRTGLYTSPHLHTFRERIRVANEFISREAVVEGVARLRAIQPDVPGVIVFDLMTALAFDYFARAGIEYAVVEVGIGGRLDATNVITPRISVITSISFDHTAILGDTLEQIAREKAGIIKPGVPVVSAPQTDEARRVIERTADEQHARLVQVGRDWKWRPRKHTLDYQEFDVERQDKTLSYDDLRVHLLGAHQLTNATNAIAATNILGESDARITPGAVRAGVARTRWAGRFEIIERAPYTILDGAHNQDSARVLVSTLKELFPNVRVQWLFGASNDKDIRGMFAELLAYAPALILTRSHHPRSAEPNGLAQLAREFQVEPYVAASIAKALAFAKQKMSAREYDVTVITGSLFIVSDARELLMREHGVRVETD